MRSISLKLFLVVVLAASNALAQGGAGAPEVGRLRAHVVYLAADKLEGRRTGTAGAVSAAEYVAKEFARLGLRPAGDGGRVSMPEKKIEGRVSAYLQSFPYVSGVEAGKANSMMFTSRAADAQPDARPATLDLRLEDDWMPLGLSTNARVENLPATFVGYGIKASELNHDDYAGVDVAGRVVVAFAGTPDGDNPHGKFVRYEETRLKAAAAREHGAKALALIAGEDDFRESKFARLRYDNAGDAGLPVVAISRASAERILQAGGIGLKLNDVQKALSAPPSAAQTTTGEPASVENKQTTARQNLSLPLANVALTINTDIVRKVAPASNVVGLLEGSDARLREEAVVVGAHYDHLGRGGQGSLAAREGEIHHGADDNASGTAALLELARIFTQKQMRPRRTLVFVAFGGEEEGLLGSSFYVQHPPVPLAQTVAMINMDMVGRLQDERLIIGGVGTAQEWRGWIGEANTKLQLRVMNGVERERRKGEMAVVRGANGQVMATAANVPRFTLALNDDGFGPSDHSSFYAQKIPVLFFFTGTHEDYHKPTDTADRINYEGEARVVGFVRDLVQAVDANASRPVYAVAKSDSQGRSTGFRIYLGTVPNYAETNDGLRLDAVRDDSPAARAGLRAGDRIVKLAGREVRNVYDYTYILAEMRAGQEYEVELMRDGQPRTLKITPAARK